MEAGFKRRLPDGTITDNPDVYGNAWVELGEKFVKHMLPANEGWRFAGCDPGMLFHQYTSSGYLRDSLRISTELVLYMLRDKQ
jgi:hypothetical protein